jgi:hypothetical protein
VVTVIGRISFNSPVYSPIILRADRRLIEDLADPLVDGVRPEADDQGVRLRRRQRAERHDRLARAAGQDDHAAAPLAATGGPEDIDRLALIVAQVECLAAARRVAQFDRQRRTGHVAARSSAG